MTNKVSFTKKEIALLIDMTSYMRGRAKGGKEWPDPKKLDQMHFKLWRVFDNFIREK